MQDKLFVDGLHNQIDIKKKFHHLDALQQHIVASQTQA
jgi:hypothetical protein